MPNMKTEIHHILLALTIENKKRMGNYEKSVKLIAKVIRPLGKNKM